MYNSKEIVLPLYDTSFKYLFKGKSRKLLNGLIKHISNINLEEFYLYDNEINSGNDSKDMRLDTIFVKDVDNPYDGDCVNVEVYKDYNEDADDLKSHYYLFSLIVQRLRSGDTYKKQTAYQVNINDGKSKDYPDERIVELCETDGKGVCKIPLYKIFNVYLSNYKNICYNGDNKYDALLSLLRCKNYDEMRKIANGCEEMIELINELEELSANNEVMGLYNSEVIHRQMIKAAKAGAEQNGIEIGEKRGIDIGEKRGISIGRTEEKNNICINMLKNKISIGTICKCLGMTKSEVEQVQKTID